MKKPNIRKIDFSEFHPLDHPVGSKRCQSFYGGWKHHLDMQWEYITKSKIKAATKCKLGFHKPVLWYRWKDGVNLEQERCADCTKKFGPWRESDDS